MKKYISFLFLILSLLYINFAFGDTDSVVEEPKASFFEKPEDARRISQEIKQKALA